MRDFVHVPAMELRGGNHSIDAGRATGQKRPVLRLVHGQGFDAAVRPLAGWLQALALKLTRSPADAADLVQDTLERALVGWGSLRPDTNHRAWLSTILQNLFIDRCRRLARTGQPVALELVAPVVSVTTPDAAPEWSEMGEAEVREALVHVQEEYRLVFELHLDGASYQAIADRLGIPRPTVGTRLLRARRALRELLQARLKGGPHA